MARTCTLCGENLYILLAKFCTLYYTAYRNAVILNVATDSETEDFIFNNLLYVEEEKYDYISAAIEDLGIDTKIELRRICDEIFADG